MGDVAVLRCPAARAAHRDHLTDLDRAEVHLLAFTAVLGRRAGRDGDRAREGAQGERRTADLGDRAGLSAAEATAEERRPPKPALAKPLAHGKPKPPRPKDGRCARGEGLGDGLRQRRCSPERIDAARVTTNPAAAPTTAIASAIPSSRSRSARLLGGGLSGRRRRRPSSGSSGFISRHRRYRADLSKSVTNAPDRTKRQEGPPKRDSISATHAASVLRSPIRGNSGSPAVQRAARRRGGATPRSPRPGHARSAASRPSDAARRSQRERDERRRDDRLDTCDVDRGAQDAGDASGVGLVPGRAAVEVLIAERPEAAQRKRCRPEAHRVHLVRVRSSAASSDAASSASSGPGSPPSGTVVPKSFSVSFSVRCTKLPKIPARSLFTVSAKPSQVNSVSSDSGAAASSA